MGESQAELKQNILACKIRTRKTHLMNGASNTEHVKKVGNRSSRKKLPFTTSRTSYSLAVLYSNNLGCYPCLLMTTTLHPHTSSSVVVTTLCRRLPTPDDDDDPLQQGYPSPFKADKKETGRISDSEFVALSRKNHR